MSTIHLHETTTATPEEFLAGLTDFGPGRLELFGPVANGHPSDRKSTRLNSSH